MINNPGVEPTVKPSTNTKPNLSKSRLKSQIDKVKPTGLPALNVKEEDASQWQMESIGQGGHRSHNSSHIAPTSKKSTASALSGLSHPLGPRQSLRDKANASNLNTESSIKEVKAREGRKASGVDMERAGLFGTHQVQQTRQSNAAARHKED